MLKINTAYDNVKWVRAIGRAVFDDNNDAIELNGTIQDIDKQKQLQDERNKFFDLSLDLIAVAGLDGYFKQLNNTWTQVLGWSETELLSKPYLDFVHPDDLESTVNAADGLEENCTVDALIELANEKNNDEILHFANELKSYIDNFDIDGFEQKLALFP